MNAPEQLPLSLHDAMAAIPQLNRKAMLVRLTISKPTTSKRDVSAESFTQQQLADNGLRVTNTLFKDPASPVRDLLNTANTVYAYHRTHTLPYVDRGERLLPVDKYEEYRDAMRSMIAEVNKKRQAVLPNYDQYVAADMAQRGARAKLDDYPTKEQFEQGFTLKYSFSPLPDTGHFLFDVSDEDKEALNDRLKEVADAARADMIERIREPLSKMIEKLSIPAGTPGSIFRDTLVENLTGAVALVRGMAMGDPDILAMCDEVDKATTGHARNPQVLRDSPIVREQAAARLKEVADKMGFMFGA